jgi:phosphotransacetylase
VEFLMLRTEIRKTTALATPDIPIPGKALANLSDLIEQAKALPPIRIVVVNAAQRAVLETLRAAENLGFVEPLLVGESAAIAKVADAAGYDIKSWPLAEAASGDADIVLVPDLVSGNILAKNLEYLAGATAAGVVLGLAAPVILSSRADPPPARLASLALAVLMHHRHPRGNLTKGSPQESSLLCAPQDESVCCPGDRRIGA